MFNVAIAMEVAAATAKKRHAQRATEQDMLYASNRVFSAPCVHKVHVLVVTAKVKLSKTNVNTVWVKALKWGKRL